MGLRLVLTDTSQNRLTYETLLGTSLSDLALTIGHSGPPARSIDYSVDYGDLDLLAAAGPFEVGGRGECLRAGEL